MSNQSLAEVCVQRGFDAPPERVFDAWLDQSTVGKWLFATPEGQVVRTEIDPRVGGKFLIVDRRKEGDMGHFGEFVEIDRPRRLVFTFAVDMFPDAVTTVNLDFTPADGGTDVKLRHEGVFEEYAERTLQGWTMILE